MGPMATHVALLRAVNLGGTNKVSMPDLRRLVESLGFTGVTTFIQSGNVLFTSRRRVAPGTIEDAISRELGMDVPVMVRTAAELGRIIEANPFPRADTSKLHVGFMADAPTPAALAGLDHDRFLPEEFAFVGTELYLHLPNGMGRTKLPGYLDRAIKIPTTIRNWNTVSKLLELAGEG
jgi:uncharacterized protein (DUF1697 family)